MNYEIEETKISFERSAGGNFIVTLSFKKEEIPELKRVIKDAEHFWKSLSSKDTGDKQP